MNWSNRIEQRAYFIKLLNWEYWPTLAFYWPMFVYGPLLALRSRHPCFFTGTNPSIDAGGLGLESKFATLQLIPPEMRPISLLIPIGETFEFTQQKINAAGLQFPIIAKPDVGYRGFLVQKIHSETELRDYLNRYSIPIILQEFLQHPVEVGVLYFRLPGEATGRITSFTQKEFLHVIGDGKSSVLELVTAKPRALLQLQRLLSSYGDELLNSIPAMGERVSLGEIGNHSKGTYFINGNHLINPKMVAAFDRIADQIPGFDYGRFDLKCMRMEDLQRGENLKVIELNGIGAEPTHIYDQTMMTYPKAVLTILWHWTMIRKIAALNHRKGTPYWKTLRILRALADLRQYHKNIREAIMRNTFTD